MSAVWLLVAATAAAAQTAAPILFPYYGYQAAALAVFDAFLHSAAESGAAKIDCAEAPSVCAARGLTPGRVHVLMPNGRYVRAQRALTPESLSRLQAAVALDGLREFEAAGAVEQAARESALFCLVARSNAGDLEEKRAVIHRLARALLFKEAVFGLISEPALYERFGRYPLSTFVYIDRDLGTDGFRGDFDFERLVAFVVEHTRGRPAGVAVVRVDDSPPENSSVIFVDWQKENWLARALCTKGRPCDVAVDFGKFQAVPIADPQDVDNVVEKFGHLWAQLNWLKRAKTVLEISFSLHPELYFAGGIAMGIGVLCAVLYALDLGNEIPEIRIGETKNA
jgi:hypothetical protein